ncbi:sulfatase [Jiangella asiatica]|uniref:Sulfatase n=1 Tax=Jiangella asiatica TaxID=2530372 RepID=A0A4R5DK50_9ACTN|nr:sulfatase [Jiangella asiatica]
MARPNIVVIVSDDHGYADFGRLGIHDGVRTPGLDRLAAQSVACTDAYVTAPICSPSRAALISGAYQQRWGATWFGDSRFPDHLPTIAERLSALGYATGYFGKVHYGQERAGDVACPPRHGFAESFYGLAGTQQGRLNYLRHSEAAVAEYGPEAARRMAVLPLFDGDDEVEYEGFLTAELGRRAVDFVARHEDEPFFAMVAFNAVHNFCFQLPRAELDRRGLPEYGDWNEATSAYDEWYEEVIWPSLPHGREYYLAQLELMDAEIGRLLDELDRRGLADDTIVVYLTDNGGSTCNFGDNAPLRGGKYSLYEGGIRVPMFVRWPAGGIPAGVERSGLVSAMDLVPTLVAAAGGAGPAAGIDGVNQLAFLRGEAESAHEALHWDCRFQWAVRSGRWKLRWTDGQDPRVESLLRGEHVDVGSGLALYDLHDDIGETRDLAGDHADVVARLAARHAAWRREVRLESGSDEV